MVWGSKFNAPFQQTKQIGCLFTCRLLLTERWRRHIWQIVFEIVTNPRHALIEHRVVKVRGEQVCTNKYDEYDIENNRYDERNIFLHSVCYEG